MFRKIFKLLSMIKINPFKKSIAVEIPFSWTGAEKDRCAKCPIVRKYHSNQNHRFEEVEGE